MKKIIGITLLVAIVLVGGVYAYTLLTQPEEQQLVKTNVGQRCAHTSGTWLQAEKECEYVSEEWCEVEGGVFNECGSACRNDPDAEICTLQCVPFCSLGGDSDDTNGKDRGPLNISYEIDGIETMLVDGRAEEEIAPGSASKKITQVFGEPVYGDVDGDGDDDALLLITQSSGGTGTFYYMVVALKEDTGYVSTDPIFVGDRIAPQTIAIQGGLAVANFADRESDEAMTDDPSVMRSLYAVVEESGEVFALPSLDTGEQVMQGYLVIGAEVREFRLCDETSYWIEGDSPANSALQEVYDDSRENSVPYTPLYATVIASIEDSPSEGFGETYEYAVDVRELVATDPAGSCQGDLIRLENPEWGAEVSSPLQISGMARGNWFFEGDFPIILTDWDGKIIAEGYATAVSEWMTHEFVPFTGELTFDSETVSGNGSLILQKDNPSDLPENDAALEIPVGFGGDAAPAG
jgi:hypothetical protein